jgi:2-polyprenyl-6-methoxyphenol hydroxylase-like FAD-dependent oxidoreductase
VLVWTDLLPRRRVGAAGFAAHVSTCSCFKGLCSFLVQYTDITLFFAKETRLLPPTHDLIHMSGIRVLICGAGIAGPALAWFLAKTGAHVTILEKSPVILAQGQNIDINGSAVSIIKKMGLLEELRRLNTTEKGAQFVDPQGRPFAYFPVKPNSRSSFTAEFEILRGDLSCIFYEATKNHPNIKYVFGTTIQEVLSNDDDSVKVLLSNGETQESDLLVAADGQWSKVRKQCFPQEYVHVRDMGMYIVYFTIPRLPEDNDWWNVYFSTHSTVVSTRPDPHGTTRAFFTHMPCNDVQEKAWREASREDRQAQEDLVRREFAGIGWQTPRLLDAMSQTIDFYFQALQRIKMTRWSNSRVVCLGDAAYAPTPLTGAGTSLAIIGAYVLAGELSKLDKDEHPSKALKAYEDAFRPFVEKTQEIPSFVPAIAHPASAWKRRIFHLVISIFAKVVATPWLMKFLDRDNHDEDFPLPQYPAFTDEGSKAAPT